jgi:hypothetical protein
MVIIRSKIRVGLVCRNGNIFYRLSDFCNEYNLSGITNGELFLQYFMFYPQDLLTELATNVFDPSGIEFKLDCLLVKEELIYGVRGQDFEVSDKPIDELKGIEWLGSRVDRNGNWVWRINPNFTA